MTCRHLTDLFEVCRTHNLKLSSSDLIRIVCPACGIEEECPSLMCDQYEQRHHDETTQAEKPSEKTT